MVLISVIIPTFNEEKTLPACLESLIRQKTTFPFEVIVIDYKSSDKTKEIARKMGVRLINENRQGRAVARQRGVNDAKGEILAFSEADCLLNPNWIEAIGNHFKRNPKVIGVTGIYSFYNSTFFLNLWACLNLHFTVYLYRLVFGNHSLRGTNFAVRKDVLSALSGFNQKTAPCDDVDLGLRMRKLGPIHFLPEMKIKTSDRRIRGRILKFLIEFFTTYFRVFILKRRGFDKSFAIIR
ncbi:hypothetical protein A3D78_02945 [Candidatus Gottesmanbacteria bacterium RIFCSPHIGHO2_02_FULL_39_14]|uniref:Glycosyltransferase 2-like domain-containing protein n=1 Tax=Candidatus Gottesmanbacteria bacterium RIFCSPHIGHO2_02_FULL_39_14 TaxID=1798383 RepID=A0A1F5ZTP5_9BACT|nr:MAG: hypothetical protein A3D78_02945 [Candidatus Gottesmanbacteria bacterium RIFCSPHIGHO2_02_FULL_39_14]